MLTANWSWRVIVMYVINVMLHTGEEKKRIKVAGGFIGRLTNTRSNSPQAKNPFAGGEHIIKQPPRSIFDSGRCV